MLEIIREKPRLKQTASPSMFTIIHLLIIIITPAHMPIFSALFTSVLLSHCFPFSGGTAHYAENLASPHTNDVLIKRLSPRLYLPFLLRPVVEREESGRAGMILA